MTSQQALINEVSLNDSGAFRAENEFNDLHSSKKVVGNEDIFTQPPGKSLGTMNYSPKHSKKPSSLGSRNMKKLSLNLSDASDSARSDETDSEVTRSNHNGSRQLSKVKRSLTVTIPSNECSEKGTPNLSLVTPSVTTTPGVPPQILPSNIDSPDSRLGLSHGFRSPKLGINYKFPSNNVIGNIDADAGDAHAHEGEISFANTSYDLQSPLFGEVPNTSIISKFTQVSLYDNYPEELQESGPLDAYPNGPANVLNDSLFLYSDPEKGRTHVDINDYDLVINVAKECNDLGNEFDDLDGEKEYMYVPWSHTSSILNQLPKLTRKIKEYDDSDEYNKRRRKILIHCHCGVSRSACVVVAYFMLKFNIGVNEAYELLKSGTSNVSVETNRRLTNDGYTIEACDKICPNMSLIFELMEFGDSLRLAKEA